MQDYKTKIKLKRPVTLPSNNPNKYLGKGMYVGSKSRFIIDTTHAIEQFYNENRFDSFSGTPEFKKLILRIISQGIDKIIGEHKDKSTQYGIYSKSTGYSAIVHWRPDFKNKSNTNNQAIVITLPPKKEKAEQLKLTHPEDIKIIVEKQLELWARNKRKISEAKDTLDDVRKIEESFFVVFHEGKFYDTTVRTFIVVN
jgi:methionyl-tRNA formyltransferase